MFITMLLSLSGLLLASCSGRKSTAAGGAEIPLVHGTGAWQPQPHVETLPEGRTDRGAIIGSERRVAGSAVRVMPKAVAYRMSGDYAANVPVNLGADGSLVSYPAPSDVSEASMPLPLADGWWLDRRGVGRNSVFTRYTYAEYSALKTVPSPAQLLASVIPGAAVTEVLSLPMTPGEAAADTAAVNDYIRVNAPAIRPE